MDEFKEIDENNIILKELKKIKKNTSKIKSHTGQVSWILSVFVIVLAISSLKSCYKSITETEETVKNTYTVSEQEKATLRSQAALESYQGYLGKIKNKAFAISETGRWSYVSGRFKEQDAIDDALLRCNSRVDEKESECKIMSVNNSFKEVHFD